MAAAPAVPPHTPTPAPQAPRAVSPNTRAALITLAAAVLLGLLGDALFRGDHVGLNLFLWIAALCAVAGAVGAASGRRGPAGRWLLVAAGFASCFAIRSADLLIQLNLLAIVLALALPGLALITDPRRARLRDYLASGLVSGGNVVAGFPMLLGHDVAWDELPARRPGRAGQIALGLVLAVPIVAVFGGLFASADPAFASLARWVVDWDLATLVRHGFVAGVFAWLAAGLMRSWLWQPSGGFPRGLLEARPPSAGAVPVGIAVGAMVLMFAVFVALQARWLFGGAALVQAVTGLSYAEYARSGFFQMVAASGLAIPVLYGAEVLQGGADARAVARLRTLGLVQLLLVGVVMASALYRMGLYMTMYGLTEDRIVGMAIIAWLAAVSAWFALTVLRGRSERFTFGAVTSGFAVLAALNGVNPEALIARVNSERVAEGKQLDYKYLGTLGADAAPALAERLATLPLEARCPVAAAVRRFASDSIGWRGWSVARTRARAAALEVDVQALGCGLGADAPAPH